MSATTPAYTDVDGLSLDIGDRVQFAADGKLGRVFTIIVFSLTGQALIRSGLTEYQVDTVKLRYVWIPGIR